MNCSGAVICMQSFHLSLFPHRTPHATCLHLLLHWMGAEAGGDAAPGSATHLKKGPASATLETTVPSGDANESVTLLAMAPDESGF